MKPEILTAKILQNNSNIDRYQIAVAVAQRTDELLNGAQSKLSVGKNVKASDLALMEMAEGVISIKSFIQKS